MSESIIAITPEVPADIVEAAEKVSNWFKQQGFGRWELAGCADRNHYTSLKATAQLVVAEYETGVLGTYENGVPGTSMLVKHIDELDNLLR